MKQLQGKVIITRSSNDIITVRVEDEASGCTAVEIEMTPDAFADAVFSRYAPCVFEANDSGVLGAKREHKTELVPFDCYGGHNDANRPKAEAIGYRIPAAVKALKPFEVDGWTGRAGDLFNGHDRVKGDTLRQKVTFYRYLRDGKPITLAKARGRNDLTT